MTVRLLDQAGVGPAMRVLDVGCENGDVSILAARLVGEEGEVVGIDREARMLKAARERVRDLGLFDAIVGRRVLMYQTEPVEVVRRLAKSLRPGA